MWPWQRINMSVNQSVSFPNPSRSYDATRQAVQFWGYDRSMEASFYLAIDALQRMQPDVQADTASLLWAFDLHRQRIYDLAAKVYARGRRGSYELNLADV